MEPTSIVWGIPLSLCTYGTKFVKAQCHLSSILVTGKNEDLETERQSIPFLPPVYSHYVAHSRSSQEKTRPWWSLGFPSL